MELVTLGHVEGGILRISIEHMPTFVFGKTKTFVEIVLIYRYLSHDIIKVPAPLYLIRRHNGVPQNMNVSNAAYDGLYIR